jgi:hypothetical protein
MYSVSNRSAAVRVASTECLFLNAIIRACLLESLFIGYSRLPASLPLLPSTRSLVRSTLDARVNAQICVGVDFWRPADTAELGHLSSPRGSDRNINSSLRSGDDPIHDELQPTTVHE